MSDSVPLNLAELKASLSKLVDSEQITELPATRRKVLEADIREVIGGLSGILTKLDPIRQPSAVFDPTNPKVIGRFVALALVAQERLDLRAVPKSYGSGVYAIYYRGPFPDYARISGTETPIYVGKASPKVGSARTPFEQGTKLCDRLSEHSKNISKATSTLSINDFEFRSLVVQSGYEAAAETYLIHLFRPIWNSETNILYGLGKHGDSASTRVNKRSPWDTFHPGRAWAAPTIEDAKTPAQIRLELNAHFDKHPVLSSLESVMENFLEELKQV